MQDWVNLVLQIVCWCVCACRSGARCGSSAWLLPVAETLSHCRNWRRRSSTTSSAGVWRDRCFHERISLSGTDTDQAHSRPWSSRCRLILIMTTAWCCAVLMHVHTGARWGWGQWCCQLWATGTRAPHRFSTIYFFQFSWNCTKSDSDLFGYLSKYCSVCDSSCCSLVVATWIYFMSFLCSRLFSFRPSFVAHVIKSCWRHWCGSCYRDRDRKGVPKFLSCNPGSI